MNNSKVQVINEICIPTSVEMIHARNRNSVSKRHGRFRYETNLKYKNKRKEVSKFS